MAVSLSVMSCVLFLCITECVFLYFDLVCWRLRTNKGRFLPQESCCRWKWGSDWHPGHSWSGGLRCNQRQLFPQWWRLSLRLLHYRTRIFSGIVRI